MVAQLKQFESLPLHIDAEAQLFDDERRLHEEVARFLELVARRSDEPTLRAQLRPILNVSGKRIRPLLPFWLMRAVGGEAHRDAIARVSAVTLVMHSAAIVIDDIEDGSVERQAQASLHLRNGIGPTLNSASLLLFAALEYLGDPALLAIAVDTIGKCHVGQALDLAFADPRVAAALFEAGPEAREQRWLACTRGKTSQLMEWSLRAAAHVMNLPAAFTEALAAALVEYGIGYQILDDVKNFRPDLVGAKAYEDVPRALCNWVCLELFEVLSPEELTHARLLYGSFALIGFVRIHRELPAAIERARRAAEARISAAQRTLGAFTHGRAGEYLSQLLDRPLEDLRA